MTTRTLSEQNSNGHGEAMRTPKQAAAAEIYLQALYQAERELLDAVAELEAAEKELARRKTRVGHLRTAISEFRAYMEETT